LDGLAGIGSCFYVDQRGYVATSFSSVEQATEVAVVFNANVQLKYPIAGVVAASRGKDIAILSVRGLPPQNAPLNLNAAAQPKLGENVMRWGGPMAEKAAPQPLAPGQAPVQQNALTRFLRAADSTAILPKIMRQLKGDEYFLGAASANARTGLDPGTNWIWLDQPCQRNCIGGPVFDAAGDVVGLISGALDARPEVAAAVHIKHVVELIPADAVKVRPLTDLRTWVDPIPSTNALPLRDPETKALGGNVSRGQELSKRFRDLQRRLTQAEQEEAEAAKTHGAVQARGFELAPQIDELLAAIAAIVPEEAYTETRRVRVWVESGKNDKYERGKYEYEDESVTRYRHSARQLAILEPMRSDLAAKQSEFAVAKEHFRYLGDDLQPFFKRLRGRLSEDIFYLADPLGLRSRAEQEALEKLLTEVIEEGGAPGMLYLVRGMSRTSLARLDDARADLAEAVDSDPKLKELTLALETRCKIRSGQIQGGLEEIKRVVSLSKNEPRVLMVAARTALDRGDTASATRYLLLAAPKCPDQAEVKLGLAWVSATGPSNLKQALEHAEAAVRLTGGHDWSSLATLAAVHARTKDFTAASAEIDAAVRLAPESAGEQCRGWKESVVNKQIPKREWKQ
jgi:Flp pilus assembly protein TadD